MTGPSLIRHDVEQSLLERNRLAQTLFQRECHPLAEASRAMAARFLDGGRLLTFGRGPYATDAQHVSVEFVHPVIVGKRALPALDLSAAFSPWLKALVRPEDIVMGFGPPVGDETVWAALHSASKRGAMTIALPGSNGSYACAPVTSDPAIHQELMEMLYHMLWETVHVFLERRHLGRDVGESAFLYPFLGSETQDNSDVSAEVTASILSKVEEDSQLRLQVAAKQSDSIRKIAQALSDRLRLGGKLILFGNGGSATDANDWALDCIHPEQDYQPIPAISLSQEPANLTAIANDVGVDAVFLRQLIAHGRPEDVAIGISTSGGSRNIVLALEEARRRGMLTVALLGTGGGEIQRRRLADLAVIVESDYIPRIQEVQASVYHIVRELLEEELYAQA